MKHMRSAIGAFALISGPALAGPISVQDLQNLPPADIYVLGEVHDNPAHHQNQVAAVAALAPKALVFEMLTPDQAAVNYAGVIDDVTAMAEALNWAGSGWPDFAMYHPIFTAAPQAAIFGAWVPRDAARAVFQQPLAEVFAGDAARFGLDAPLPDDQQAAREALQLAAHCDALPTDLLPGMVAVQRLRDGVLAQAALQALEETGGPVAVIAGTGHARTDWGMPFLLNVAAPDVTVLAIGQFEIAPPENPPFDLWLTTDATERPDPCAAFQ